MNILDIKYLGEFKEERDGETVLVRKYEHVTPVATKIDNIDATIARLQEQKESIDKAEVGEIEVIK